MSQDQEVTMAGLLKSFKGVCCDIMNENREVAIAAQELVNTVTGAAGVQDESKVISPENDDDEMKDEDGGEISDDDDQSLMGPAKVTPNATPEDKPEAKPEGTHKGASLDKQASALSVAKVIRKRALGNAGVKSTKNPAKPKPGPAKPKPGPANPKDGPAKPAPAKPAPAKPPTDDDRLEATGAGEDW